MLKIIIIDEERLSRGIDGDPALLFVFDDNGTAVTDGETDAVDAVLTKLLALPVLDATALFNCVDEEVVDVELSSAIISIDSTAPVLSSAFCHPPPRSSTVDAIFQPLAAIPGKVLIKAFDVSLLSSCSRIINPGDLARQKGIFIA